MDTQSNYLKYRGKCKEMCDALVLEDPTLKLVRGYYFEPTWHRDEPHWWCVNTKGAIVDPTKLQFPTGGIVDFYTEFDGTYDCEQCGKNFPEAQLVDMGNYATCSTMCAKRLVGVA